ncbi:MAG: hypothetical protein ACFFD2_29025, partial [Promethearchaeota archaeon]
HDLGFIFPSECKDDFSKEDHTRFLYQRDRRNNLSLSKFIEREIERNNLFQNSKKKINSLKFILVKRD